MGERHDGRRCGDRLICEADPVSDEHVRAAHFQASARRARIDGRRHAPGLRTDVPDRDLELERAVRHGDHRRRRLEPRRQGAGDPNQERPQKVLGRRVVGDALPIVQGRHEPVQPGLLRDVDRDAEAVLHLLGARRVDDSTGDLGLDEVEPARSFG